MLVPIIRCAQCTRKKSLSLSQGRSAPLHYDVFNRGNVTLVDLKPNPIQEVTPQGVVTSDGALHQLDILVLATGFDSVTGGILAIDIEGKGATTLKDKWADGVQTHLGLATEGFPNMFLLYGPQAPTSFCNGPTCAELQGEWIVEALKYLRNKGVREVEATKDAEVGWTNQVHTIGDATLLPLTESEYMGTNVPGKRKEMLNYLGGLPMYMQQIHNCLAQGLAGFRLK